MGIKWSRDRKRHVTLKGQTRDPNTLRVQYPENSWRCYLATIANYYVVCCKAVQSAILAQLGFLFVNVYSLVATQKCHAAKCFLLKILIQ